MMLTEGSHNRSLLLWVLPLQKNKETKYGKIFNAFSLIRVSNACRFSGEHLQGHGQIAKKMYILLRKSLRQLDSEDKNRQHYAG